MEEMVKRGTGNGVGRDRGRRTRRTGLSISLPFRSHFPVPHHVFLIISSSCLILLSPFPRPLSICFLISLPSRSHFSCPTYPPYPLPLFAPIPLSPLFLSSLPFPLFVTIACFPTRPSSYLLPSFPLSLSFGDKNREEA